MEGLALYFEAASRGTWRGPGEVHPQRLKMHLASDRAADGVFLDRLVSGDDGFNLLGTRAEAGYGAA